MNNIELLNLLNELDEDIDRELSEFFNNNPALNSKFSKLINIVVWDDNSLDKKIVDKLDILTDNMDSFNFGVVKDNITEIKDLLE